ncbi:hypothetical protein KBD08_04225 [Candidatus Babeliales bacterium]|nr:hypothetical protein [Candidatus Babeliales bacterium]
MKQKKVIFLWIMLLNFCIAAKNKDVSKQYVSFNKRVMQWESGLTKSEKEFNAPLLSIYRDTYEQYRKNSKNSDLQATMTDVVAVLENLMQSWDGFYKNHADAESFNDLFNDWTKRLSVMQQKRLNTLIQSYKDAYAEYDKNPARAQNKENLKIAQQKIQAVM